MKNQINNRIAVVKSFYRKTCGRFYTLVEKERLFRMLATANVLSEEAADELWEAVKLLEQKEVRTLDECEVSLLMSRCSSTSDGRKWVLPALRDVLLERKTVEEYPSRSAWYRDVYCQNTPEKLLERSMMEYATGKVDASIQSLEKIVPQTSEPVLEYLAVIAMEGGVYEKVYEYSVRVQNVTIPGTNEQMKLDLPYFAQIEEYARTQIPQERIAAICAKVREMPAGRFIGFTG